MQRQVRPLTGASAQDPRLPGRRADSRSISTHDRLERRHCEILIGQQVPGVGYCMLPSSVASYHFFFRRRPGEQSDSSRRRRRVTGRPPVSNSIGVVARQSPAHDHPAEECRKRGKKPETVTILCLDCDIRRPSPRHCLLFFSFFFFFRLRKPAKQSKTTYSRLRRIPTYIPGEGLLGPLARPGG